MLTITDLEAFPIFDGIPPDTMARIAQLAQTQEYDRNAIIFEEGQAATHLYGVLEGEVELSIVFRDRVMKAEVRYEDYVRKRVDTIERDIVIEVLDPGDIFAWSSLSEPHRLTTTATSTEPTRVFAIDASELEAVLAQATDVGYLFMQRVATLISRRLRRRTEKLLESWHQAFDEAGAY